MPEDWAECGAQNRSITSHSKAILKVVICSKVGKESLISTDIEYIIKIYIKFLMYTFSFHNGSNKNWLCTSFGHVPGPLKNEGDGNQALGDDSI